MKIFNLRANFSNNSSSDHSIVFIPTDQLSNIHDEMYDGDQGFGWEQFTLKSKEHKKDYLIASIYAATKNNVIINKIFNEDANPEGYVDHQSELTFPNNIQGNINYEFIEEYCNYIINTDNIVILGGNDNGGVHPLSGIYNENKLSIKLPTERNSDNFIAEKYDNYWVYLNRLNGYKTRFSFDYNTLTPTKSKVPELIDIKITDFCPYGCEFCYQGSTSQGKHADIGFIKELAQELSKQRVLEVALGGGEPTLHPQFIDILEIFKQNNLIVNFTTKNSKIFNNKKIMELASSIAYSISNANEVQALENEWKIVFQVVMGTITKKELQMIITEIKKHYFTWWNKLTLLGFKTTHRGESFNKIEYDWLIDLLRENEVTKIGFDTLLVQEFEEMFKLLEMSDVFYNSKEAAFSCYIDAVNHQIAPTSYCSKSKYKQFDFNNWIPTYQSF